MFLLEFISYLCNVIIKATLKKSWRSNRGKLYPKGTTFSLVKKFLENESALYEFNVPNERYGIVVIPNKVFLQLTEEGRKLKKQRKKAYEDHMKKCKEQIFK